MKVKKWKRQKKLNNVFVRFICIFLFFTLFINKIICYAASDSDIWVKYGGEINGRAGFLLDANSGFELYEKRSDEKLYPASLTKIMTAVVVFDNVNNIDEILTFSYNAVTNNLEKNATTIGASAGDTLSVKDCLYAILLPSANDAANALAEYVAGSIRDFVMLMNEKAKELGMTNTHFENPTGLHHDNQYTTARDLGKLMMFAMKNDIFTQICSTNSYKHAPIRRYKNPDNSNNVMLNTNSMLIRGNSNYYRGTIAGKTGYTSQSGYNLIVATERDGMRLIFVVLGCKKINDRFVDAKNVLNFYYENYKSLMIKDVDARFNTSMYDFTIKNIVIVEVLHITVNDRDCITLPKDVDFSDLTYKISYRVEDVNDPYSIGSISYYLNNKLVGSTSLQGRGDDSKEEILTSYLNLSSSVDEVKDVYSSQNSNYINVDMPIYRDSSGNLVFSKPILTLFMILSVLITITILFLFFTSRYFANVNKMVYNRWRKFKRRYRL